MKLFGVTNYFMGLFKKKEAPALLGGHEVTHADVLIVRDFIWQGKKVDATRHVRRCTGLGLKEAKCIVEDMMKDDPLVPNSALEPEVQGGMEAGEVYVDEFDCEFEEVMEDHELSDRTA
jgi:hypothetical protein